MCFLEDLSRGYTLEEFGPTNLNISKYSLIFGFGSFCVHFFHVVDVISFVCACLKFFKNFNFSYLGREADSYDFKCNFARFMIIPDYS